MRTKKFTAGEVMEYILTTSNTTFDPETFGYFVVYDLFHDEFSYEEFLNTKEFRMYGISASETVDYADEYFTDDYLTDDDWERFFEETERFDDPDFIKLCENLADKLNAQLTREKSVKFISGLPYENNKVTVEIDGKEYTRKVCYKTDCGLYITVKNHMYFEYEWDFGKNL